MPSFDIRAEFPGNRCFDFAVVADSLEKAKPKAEATLQPEIKRLPDGATCEWRGAVVFVGHTPRF